MLRCLSCCALSIAPASSAHLVARRPCCSVQTHAVRASLLHAKASTSPVQRVYDLAMAGELHRATEAMDALTSDDVGLRPGGADSSPGGPVAYHHVHAEPSLSIGIFVLPPGASIPLHDHPGMTVLSKLLFGSLRVVSYDMPSAAGAATPNNPFQALLRGSGGGVSRRLLCDAPSRREVCAPCPTLRLDAVGGNIHSFEALEHTAIFDVLTPPYSDFEGRSCHYYEVDEAGVLESGVHKLREVPWPESLRVVNRPYDGAPVAPLVDR
jgi:hypothetical protein